MWMLALAQSVTTVCSQCFLIVSAHPLWAKFGTNSSVQQRPIKPEESSSPVGGARAREAHWRHLCSALIRRGGGASLILSHIWTRRDQWRHFLCLLAIFQVNKTRVILFPSSGAGGGMGKREPLTAPLFVKILIQLIRPEEYGHWARRDH
jgi:hypothetical protein